MLQLVEFLRFRGFLRLKAEVSPHAYIVGPNSAGKSTLIEAIGLAEQCLRIAKRKPPTLVRRHTGASLRAYPLPDTVDNEGDPVRHDFGSDETRVSVEWANGARVHMIWPATRNDDDADEAGYFFLELSDGTQPLSPQTIRDKYSQITVLPVVTPLDRVEELKNPKYVEQHSNSRLASRHFRNHARLMSQASEWDNFRDFSRGWLPEIELLDVTLHAGINRLAVFYREAGSRVPKELAWAGDGIQIWVQLLWHLFRARSSRTVVLDEPEVYLHPDLQRRLVRLLDGLGAQIILASHSADVVAEAPPDGILWVDRRTGGAKRARSQQTLSALSDSLGSSYNLALAQSMRAQLVVASDCDDLRTLRFLAKHVGAMKLANEYRVSLVRLRSVGNWASTTLLGESLRSVLPPKLPAVVLLQGGYRETAANTEIARNLAAPGVSVRVLAAAELENYLIDAETVARASGAAPEAVAVRIADACTELRDASRATFLSARVRSAATGEAAQRARQAEEEFESSWEDLDLRMALVRAKDLIKHLNQWLEAEGYRPISGYTLSKAMRPQLLAADLLAVLLEIDEMVT